MFRIIFANVKSDVGSKVAVGSITLIFPLGVAAWQSGSHDTMSTKYTVPLFEAQGMEMLVDPGCIVPSRGHVGFFSEFWKAAMQASRSLFG